MKQKRDYFDLVLRIIILVGMILIIYWFVQLMLGGSPTFSQFNTSLIMILVGLVVHLYYKSGKFSQFVVGTFPQFEKNIEHSFERVKGDMTSMKEDLSLIKKKLKV